MDEKITINIEDYENLKHKETVLMLLWEANAKSQNPLELIRCSFPDCKAMLIRDKDRYMEVFHRCTELYECSSKYEHVVEKECEVGYCEKHVTEFGDSHSYNLGVDKCYVCKDCIHLYSTKSLPI